MTPEDFCAIQDQLAASNADLAEMLGGYKVRIVQRWRKGERKIPPAVAKLMLHFRSNDFVKVEL